MRSVFPLADVASDCHNTIGTDTDELQGDVEGGGRRIFPSKACFEQDVRLRAFEERRQDFPKAGTIGFGQEVGRRHSNELVAGVSKKGASAAVRIQNAPARRLEENDRIGLRVQRALELRRDRWDALLIVDVGERSDPGQDLAGRAPLRDSAAQVPAKRPVATSSKTALRLEHLPRTHRVFPVGSASCRVIGVNDAKPRTGRLFD